MMTINKLNIYIKFKGDYYLFLEHMNQLSPEDLIDSIEERNMGDNDFNYIDESLQEIRWIKNNLVADSYRDQILKGMKSYMDEDTFQMLWAMEEYN